MTLDGSGPPPALIGKNHAVNVNFHLCVYVWPSYSHFSCARGYGRLCANLYARCTCILHVFRMTTQNRQSSVTNKACLMSCAGPAHYLGCYIMVMRDQEKL